MAERRSSNESACDQIQRPPPSRGLELGLAGLGLGDGRSAGPTGREKTRPPVGVVVGGGGEPSEAPKRSDERPVSEADDVVEEDMAGRGESTMGDSGCWEALPVVVIAAGRAGEGEDEGEV